MKLELVLPKEENLDEDKVKAHNAAIFAVWPRLEKTIKEKMYEQLIQTYSENVGMAKTREEIVLATVRGNGILEGMAILLEKWRLDAQAHEGEGKPKEPFDKNNPLPEI